MNENEQEAAITLDHPALKNRVVILNGFSNDEILAIMRAVKALTKPANPGDTPAISVPSKDLIFAKTTPLSLQEVLMNTIVDMSGDHEYLQKNPPQVPGRPV